MRFLLFLNLFAKPVCLAIIGLFAMTRGDALSLQSPNLANQLGTLLTNFGLLLFLSGTLWGIWGCVRLIRAKLGHGLICHCCGGPMDEKQGRWGDYRHCLNCGRNESIRY